MKNYFVANLTDGTQLIFNKKCNHVDYESQKMCVFNHKYNKSGSGVLSEYKRKCLGIVPFEKIVSIVNINEK